MEHSEKFERFLAEDLSLHPSVDWMQKGDDMNDKIVPIDVQKEFFDTLEQGYVELNTPAIHPAERMEYIMARLYPVMAMPEKEVASDGDIENTISKLIDFIGDEIIAWQPQIKHDLSTRLLGSVIFHKKHKGIPLAERCISNIEKEMIKFFPKMDGEPSVNSEVEPIDIRQFVEKYNPNFFSVGVNEEHAFLPIQMMGYLSAIERTGERIEPRLVMEMLNRLVFEGEIVRPCFSDLPMSQALGNILLGYLVQKVPPCHLPAVLTAEKPLAHYKKADPRLGIYESMKQVIQEARRGPNGPQNPKDGFSRG